MTLGVDELRRLSSLLDESIELAPDAREAWLAGIGNDSRHLLPTLRALLDRAAQKETDDLLARGPVFELAASGPRPGDAVGAYRLLSELGSGGMGAVWLAERRDGSLKRKVALKLPHLGWASGLAERFAREREILSSLEHPHIARLYDAGFDEMGRPYMALEYVDGKPIDEFCRQRALDVPARLKLLLQVADAVAFAHGRLVLHRDLKPGNILVDVQGQARLLDFGIAKLMEGDGTEETQLTRLGGRAFTLDYASPEQIRGEAMGTASDVYSLGVVAYELLAGNRPYRLKLHSAAEIAEAISVIDAQPASTSAAEPALRRALKGDLDAILNKALKKDPRERYATVNALAEDLDRFARGEAVLAQRDSRAYRVRKFVSRHRLPVVAGASVALALLAGIMAAAWQAGLAREQARRAAQQAEIAGKEAKRASAVQDFLLDIFRANSTRQADPVAAQRTTARELLDIGAARVSERLKDEPESQLAVRATLAEMYLQLGLNQRASELSEQNLPLARRLLGPRSERLAELLLGHVAILQERGGREQIPALLQEALQVLDAAGAKASMVRGEALLELAWYWDAEPIMGSRQAAQAAVAFFVEHHPRARGRVTAHITAGRVHTKAGEFAASEAQYRSAVEVARQQGDSASTLLHDALNHLGDAQRGLLKLREAEASYREALLHANRAYGEGRGETLVTRARLLLVLAMLGRRAEADALRSELRAAIAAPDPRLEGGWRAVVAGMFAEALPDQGRPDLAERWLRDDVEDLRRKLPRASLTARREAKLADVLVALGRFDEARRVLAQASARWTQVTEGAGPLPFDAMFTLVAARLALARGAAAEALALLAPVTLATPVDRLWLAIERSHALHAMGQFGKAAQAASEAMREIEKSPEPERPKALEAAARLSLGQALAAGGDIAGGRVQIDKAVALRREHDEAGSLELARALQAQAALSRDQ